MGRDTKMELASTCSINGLQCTVTMTRGQSASFLENALILPKILHSFSMIIANFDILWYHSVRFHA